MADGLRAIANPFGIVKEAALPGVVLIHPLHHFAQRRTPMAGVAHRKIKHDPEQFPFVVVGYAAIGSVVIAVTLKPGVEARLFRRLREVRRTPLEFRDLLASR